MASNAPRSTGAHLLGELLASALDAVPHGVALFDGMDRLVFSNHAYDRLLGDLGAELRFESLAELDGSPDPNFADERDRSRFHGERSVRRTQPIATFDLCVRNGRTLRLTDGRTAQGATVRIVWDVTDDRRGMDELRESREAAMAASQAKSEFLASISHEVKNSLNVILGFAQLLDDDREEPCSIRQRERLARISSSGEHLRGLVNDVLDLSRIEACGGLLSLEPVNVLEVIEEVRATLEPMAARAGVHLSVEPPRDGHATVVADWGRFSEILMNYGTNAVKYNRPSGKVTFSASAPDPDSVRVTVTDTGIGISNDLHANLFRPFERAGQESGPIEGTGIGLVVAKRLSESMGGRVGFCSSPRAGSEFWVELPSHPSPGGSFTRAASAPPPRVRARLR